MKKVSFQFAKGKSIDYLKALHQFFNGISEIAYIEDIYFVRSTPKRVYFYVGNIAHGRYGYNYSANMFVRKKDLSVEFCIKDGVVATQQYLDIFKRDNQDDDEWN